MCDIRSSADIFEPSVVCGRCKDVQASANSNKPEGMNLNSTEEIPINDERAYPGAVKLTQCMGYYDFSVSYKVREIKSRQHQQSAQGVLPTCPFMRFPVNFMFTFEETWPVCGLPTYRICRLVERYDGANARQQLCQHGM